MVRWQWVVWLSAVMLVLASCGPAGTTDEGTPAETAGTTDEGTPAESPAERRELVVAAWAGKYLEGWQRSLIPKFEEEHNVEIVWVPGGSTQTLATLVAAKDNPQHDVAMMDEGPLIQAVPEGVFEPIEVCELKNADQLYDIAHLPHGFGIGFSIIATGMYYNTEVFNEKGWDPPTSWLDLFEEKYAGHVTTFNPRNGAGLNHLLMMNELAGGDYTQNDMDPGFKAAAELSPNILTFDRFGDTATLIQQGEAWIGAWSIDQIQTLRELGGPVEGVYPKEGLYGLRVTAAVVSGRPNTDLACAFIDSMLSAEEQRNTAEYTGFSPLHPGVELTPEEAELMIYGLDAIEAIKIPDWEVIAKYRAEWTERWDREVEGLR